MAYAGDVLLHTSLSSPCFCKYVRGTHTAICVDVAGCVTYYSIARDIVFWEVGFGAALTVREFLFCYHDSGILGRSCLLLP